MNIRSDLNRETLVDRIVYILEDRILTGELPPGTPLSEGMVAREFEVSRVPAREALQRLQEMNLVRKTLSGREVIKFGLDEFRELYELKNVVEAYGVMKGAMNATEEDRRKVESVLGGIRNCTRSKDLKKLQKLNFQFHDLLVYCSRNQRIIQTYVSLVKQVRWAASHSFFLANRLEQSLKEHMAILKAFKQKDGRKVRALLEAHTSSSMERSLKQLELKEKKAKS